MPITHIEDPSDRRLVDYARLSDARHRSRVETADPPGFFIAEGTNVVRRLLASHLETRSVVVTEAKLDAVLADRVEGEFDVLVVSAGLLAEVAGYDVHRGVLAAAVRPDPATLAVTVAGARHVAVLEGVNDHENMGAVFRSAAAFGIGAIVLDPTCCDPWYRRSVRVSMGGVITVPFWRARSWPATIRDLTDLGFTVLAFTPSPEATDLTTLEPPDRAALLFGAEGPGLSEAAVAAADHRVRIPMSGDVDSLNVGHAAAIGFFAVTAGG